MGKTGLYFFAAAWLVVGCSRDPYRKYVGLWERVADGDRASHEVLEIKRDGDAIVFNDNVLAEHNFLGRPKQPTVMVQRDGQLSVANGLAEVPLGLSDDELLLLADRRYKSIDKDRLQEIRKQIAEEKQAAEQALATCKELDAQWKAERDAISHPHRESEAVLAQKRDIYARYKAKAKEVPHCSIWW